VRYVTFPNLWRSWKATFQKAWAIGDDVIATKLKGANFRIGTGDRERDSPVVTNLTSVDMDTGIDLCVDSDKPANNGELAAETVSFIFYTKRAPSVTDSQDDLDTQIDAAKNAVTANATDEGVAGYLGEEMFGFLCSWAPAANLARVQGYNYKASATEPFTYPLYRKPSIAALAKKQASGVKLGKGDDVYEEEREARYELEIGRAEARVNTYLQEREEDDDPDVKKMLKEEYSRDSGEPVPEELLNEEWDNDDAMGTMVTAYEATRKTEREAEVERRIGEVSHFSSKGQREQKTIRNRIAAEVKAEIR
jgi:hypothetical protein